MTAVAAPLATALIAMWSLAIAVMDLRHRRIPNALSLGSWLVGVVHLLVWQHSPLGESASSAWLAAGFALLVTLPGYVTRQLGAGDVKFLVGIGLLTSWPLTLICFAAGALLGAATAVVSRNRFNMVVCLPAALRQPGSRLMNWATQDTPKRHVPFGTCLAIGLFIGLGWQARA
ncbi:MAG: prepilin peptidase [Burkholderiales bacterium]|nr:prepilin peptidase [Burkholderiales bacterium]MBH2015249.1 prepilin peptidase [Burkholderiales bacterium]